MTGNSSAWLHWPASRSWVVVLATHGMKGTPRQEAGKGIGRIGVHCEHEMHDLAPLSVSATRKEKRGRNLFWNAFYSEGEFSVLLLIFPHDTFFIIYFYYLKCKYLLNIFFPSTKSFQILFPSHPPNFWILSQLKTSKNPIQQQNLPKPRKLQPKRKQTQNIKKLKLHKTVAK